jgi:hypothetical protein
MYELHQSRYETNRVNRPKGSFAIAAFIGVGVALLLSPAGRDIRQGINRTARRVGPGVKDVIGKARNTINGVKEDARISMERARDTFEHTRVSEGHTHRRIPAG